MAAIPLIKRRIITEKATLLAGLGKYVFLVKDSATKSEIKKRSLAISTAIC